MYSIPTHLIFSYPPYTFAAPPQNKIHRHRHTDTQTHRHTDTHTQILSLIVLPFSLSGYKGKPHFPFKAPSYLDLHTPHHLHLIFSLPLQGPHVALRPLYYIIKPSEGNFLSVCSGDQQLLLIFLLFFFKQLKEILSLFHNLNVSSL
jgi:hypothetical protein